MFLSLLLDISVPTSIASVILWPRFASVCGRAVLWNTTGTVGRAEAEIQPVSCSTGSWPPLPALARVTCKISCKAAGLLLSGGAMKCSISAAVRARGKGDRYPTMPVTVGAVTLIAVCVTVRARNGAPPGKAFATAAIRCSARLSGTAGDGPAAALDRESVQPWRVPTTSPAAHRLQA